MVIDIAEDRSVLKPATINVVLGCFSSFYRYHNQLGHTDVTIIEPKSLPGNRYKALLHRVFKNKPAQRPIISVRQVKELPKTITEAQFIQLSNTCTNYRDKFLIWLQKKLEGLDYVIQSKAKGSPEPGISFFKHCGMFRRSFVVNSSE